MWPYFNVPLEGWLIDWCEMSTLVVFQLYRDMNTQEVWLYMHKQTSFFQIYVTQ
jgi:hypothetical protein